MIVLLLTIVILSSVYTMTYVKKPNQSISPFQEQSQQVVAAPRDVYQIPEFKLALDKEVNESMTTIVQVKLGLAYKAGDQKTLNEIIKRKEQIRDKIQYVIAKKRYEDVDTSESRENNLKKDLLNEINKIMKEGKILNVYFDTFVVSHFVD